MSTLGEEGQVQGFSSLHCIYCRLTLGEEGPCWTLRQVPTLPCLQVPTGW